MVNISRVRASITGFPGGPGVSTFYCLNPVTFIPLLTTYYTNLSSNRPAGCAVQVENVGDVLDPLSGALTGSWSGPAQAALPGFGTGAYPAPAGLCVTWNTGTVLDRKRLRGRTFMVPLAGDQYQNDGSLSALSQSNHQINASTLVADAAANFVVWHRPRPVSLRYPVARAGGYAAVVSANVRDKVAVLRSRRD